MGFFFRKSIKAGAFRINLSKSGIGVSAGVKGARISTGPRGTELHLGRKGIYYRKKLAGQPRGTSVSPYPQIDLRTCTSLTYQNNYTDVVYTLGMPDGMVTKMPPEAETLCTILYYKGKGAVFLVYEGGTTLGDTHYLGTLVSTQVDALFTR